MKRVLTALALLVVAGTASAQWHHHGHYGVRHHGYHSGGHGGWVGPLVGGVVLGAIIANNRDPIVVQQPPVYVQPPQSVIIQRQPVCTEWREIQNPDGVIYRERTCTQ